MTPSTTTPDVSAEHAGRLPVIAIIGRPNAGKSSLFNRLTRTRRALVDPEPGVTRDRNIAEAQHEGRRFLVIDTGGFVADAKAGLEAEVQAQSELAMEEADAIILLLDGRAGVAPADRDVVERLRRARKPVWIAVNKLDTPAHDGDAADFFTLGVDRLVPISVAHGRGVGELLDEVLDALPGDRNEFLETEHLTAHPEEARSAVSKGVSVAIVGRPNVGKSSLLNRLLGYERSIVTPTPGTTRDAIDTPVTFDGRSYVLVDTAGIRRRPRVHAHLERACVVRALRALERSAVAILVIDASEGMTDQDARIAGYAWERGRALMLVVNKCDLIGGRRRATAAMERDLPQLYPFLDAVPLLFTSAETGAGLRAVVPALGVIADNHARELQTSRLNQVIHKATETTAPPSVRGKRPTFQYAVQTGLRPPTVTIFGGAPDLVPPAYTRFLVHQLRQAFPLSGTPVLLRYRARNGGERKVNRQRSKQGSRVQGSKGSRGKRQK